MAEWSVHHGNRVIVLVNYACAGGALPFVGEAALAKIELLADVSHTYCHTVLSKLIRFCLMCYSIENVFDEAFG